MEGNEKSEAQNVESRSIFQEFLANIGRTVRKDKPVLHPSMSGGPQGLGDPDSTYLRTVETNIMIPERTKERAKSKCVPEIKAFGKCGEKQGGLVMFKCRQEAKNLENCLEPWYNNAELIKLATEEYLQERAEYRRTGISKKDRKKEEEHEQELRQEVLKRLEAQHKTLGDMNTNNSDTNSKT